MVLAFFVAAQIGSGSFEVTEQATGLYRPVTLVWLPSNTLLIGQQYSGVIRRWKNSGGLQAQPYADLSLHAPGGFELYPQIPPGGSQLGYNELGFLGMCVQPGLSNNPYVYVFLTVQHTSGSPTKQQVWRLTTTTIGGVEEMTGSPTVLIDDIPSSGSQHNGGGIAFGPDGMLYVCVGENNPPSGQHTTDNWRGKILRFNADGTIPGNNPWGNAIYSKGHRNPVRLAWHPATSQLYSTEAGPVGGDELNQITAGTDYGWPAPYSPSQGPWYQFSPVGTAFQGAPVGICFYTGSLFASQFSGKLFLVESKGNIGGVPAGRVVYFDVTASPAPQTCVSGLLNPIEVVQGPDGALYVTTIGFGGSAEGKLYRIGYAGGSSNLSPTASFTATDGSVALSIDVDGTASSDADGSIASYSWNWGDGATTTSASPTNSHTYATGGSYMITLTVADNGGATSSMNLAVAVGGSPPSPHIEQVLPTTGTAPLTIQFAGHGHDDQGTVAHVWSFGDGSAPQTEPSIPADTNTSGTHTYQNPGTYTLTLTITDAEGLQVSQTATITVTAPPVASTSSDDGGSGGGGGGCGCVGFEAAVIALWLLRRRGSAR